MVTVHVLDIVGVGTKIGFGQFWVLQLGSDCIGVVVFAKLDWCSITRLDSCCLQGVSLMDRIIVHCLDDLEVSQRMFPMGFQIMLRT